MSLFGALAVSASGMDAQRVRAELITENLANADTTRTPQGGPYRRKDAIFTSASMSSAASTSSSVVTIIPSAPGNIGNRRPDQ